MENEQIVNGLTFRQWRNKVDALLSAKLGIGVDDLADSDLYSEWENESTPNEGAYYALENDDLYSEAIDEGLVDF
jgi:hypothetical protein